MESTVRVLLKDEGGGLPDNCNSEELCAEWFRKAWAVIDQDLDNLDTTERHRQVLCTSSNKVLDAVKTGLAPSWEIIYSLLFFISKLMGFGFSGKKHYELIVTQPDSCYWQEQIDANQFDPLQSYHDEKNIVSKRSELVKYLHTEKGESYRDIAKILNLTEFQVKQLKRKEFPRSISSRDEIKAKGANDEF